MQIWVLILLSAFVVVQETDANPNPSFWDSLLSPFYKFISFLGISIKGASAEVNNTEKVSANLNNDEIAAEVVEIKNPKKRIFIGDKSISSGFPLTVAPLTHTNEKKQEVPIEVVIQNQKQYLNFTPTYEVPTNRDDSTMAKVIEIPGKEPINLKTFLESFTEPNPWYPDLYALPPQGHLIDIPKSDRPPDVVEATPVRDMMSAAPTNKNYVNSQFPEHVGDRQFPVYNGPSVILIGEHPSKSDTDPPKYSSPDNKFYSVLPPFPTVQSLNNPYQPNVPVSSVQVIPLTDTAPKPPSDPNHRDAFPLFTSGTIASKGVLEYRPAFPIFETPPAPQLPLPAILPPHHAIPFRHNNIIQCRPRFPIYQGYPVVSNTNTFIPTNDRLITAHTASERFQYPKRDSSGSGSVGHYITSVETKSPPLKMPSNTITDNSRVFVPVSGGLVSGDVAKNTKEVWN